MKIKLIIWLPEGTLWNKEQDNIVLTPIDTRFPKLIRTLREKGIGSTIYCADKPEHIEDRLTTLGIKNSFPFIRPFQKDVVAWTKELIKDTGLDASSILFISADQGPIDRVQTNINCIYTVDSKTFRCINLLQSFASRKAYSGPAQVDALGALEKRNRAQKESPLSKEDFLRQSDLHITAMVMTNVLPFVDQIKDLIASEESLNYTRSRLRPCDLEEAFIQSQRHWTAAIFAWDKYGYYGLVGFVCVEHNMWVVHFTLDFKVKDMGIENWIASTLSKFFPDLRSDIYGFRPHLPDWIHLDPAFDAKARINMCPNEFNDYTLEPDIHFCGLCQSGAIAYFAQLTGHATCDNISWIGKGYLFSISQFKDAPPSTIEFPPFVVIPTYIPYLAAIAPNINDLDEEAIIYRTAIRNLFAFAETEGTELFLVMSPENALKSKWCPPARMVPIRTQCLNAIWREEAKNYKNITIMETEGLGDPEALLDLGHLDLGLLEIVGKNVRKWYDSFPHYRSAAPLNDSKGEAISVASSQSFA